jgi:hypothetical protein
MITDDPKHPDINKLENDGTGMNKAYIVLSEAERAKGFIRPVRTSYTHLACRVNTSMGMALAETWARDIYFYGKTYCCECGGHFPVSEFVWNGSDTVLGT